MKTTTKKMFWGLLACAFLATASLVSCDNTASNDEEIEAMEARLNAIMLEHQQMQSDYEGYTAQLTEKDSVIQAQAREIEKLIRQLKAAKAKAKSAGSTTAAAPEAKVDAAETARQSAELQAKQRQIEELENQLAEQNKQVADLQEEARKNAAAGTPISDSDRKTFERLRQQVDNQDGLIAKLTNENVRLTNRNDSLTSQVAWLMTQQVQGDEVTKANMEYAAQVSQLQGQLKDQQDEIDRLKKEVEEQKALVAEAEKKIEAAEKQAAAAKSEAAKQAKSKGSVNKKLSELQELCDSYAAEIERLRAENTMLRYENDSLRGEVMTMRQNAERNAIDNARLAMKVNRASMLVTKDLSVTPLKRLSNNVGKETNRAASTTCIRIDGMILTNYVVDPGTVMLYAAVTDAQKRVVCNGAPDCAGFEIDGNQIQYTVAQPIEFTGEARTFSIQWNKDESVVLQPGTYTMTLYANGNVIGTQLFKLK